MKKKRYRENKEENKKASDEDGIRTHARRAEWISSPSP